MQLCLVRHALAAERGVPGIADEDRPLTPRGRARMEEATNGLARLLRADLVVSSPYLRAVQTADILVGALGLARHSRLDALAYGDDAQLFTVLGASGARCAVAVGHEPHMSRTLSLALTGDHDLARSVLKKGSAALITFDGAPQPGAGALEWLLPPAALRALAAWHSKGLVAQ